MIARGAFLSLFVLATSLWVENGHSQAQGNPNVQRENSAHSNPSDVFSIPVRIIPSPSANESDAADAKAREESNRREDENLAIQRSVADSSKEVAHYSFFQTWIGAISLVLSFVTVGASGAAAWFAFGAVKEARKSTAVAQKSLAVTEDTAKKQLRAYLVLTGTAIPVGTEEDYFIIKSGFKNCGQTPALITHIGRIAFLTNRLTPDIFPKVDMSEFTAVVGPGEELHFHVGHTSEKFPNLRQEVAHGRVNAAMRIHARYTDIFGDEHIIKFTRVIEGQRELNADFGISFDYPDEVD
ncbi:hypothetical protein [Brucella lupini]